MHAKSDFPLCNLRLAHETRFNHVLAFSRTYEVGIAG